jgi:RimJ/RimL family protein N-acetyltransferase
MSAIATVCTPRLRLRPWRDEDLTPFAELNADPRVMEFFPKTLDRGESDAMVARIREHFDRHGFGQWAVEVPGVADFIGFVGLALPPGPRALGPRLRHRGGPRGPGVRLPRPGPG